MTKIWLAFWTGFVAIPVAWAANGTVCAGVKMEVAQEMTLARQAFDASMRIENNIASRSLQNIRIDVWFTDQAGCRFPAPPIRTTPTRISSCGSMP